jgi:hypothetical protein
MGGVKLSPEQTRVQDRLFVSQCSLSSMRARQPLQWLTPPETPASPESVMLLNTGQWQRHRFHLTGAYFGGRESNAVDLRLVDNYWVDGQAYYFSRIWITKSALDNQTPDLNEH